jgi:hypothetical protein
MTRRKMVRFGMPALMTFVAASGIMLSTARYHEIEDATITGRWVFVGRFYVGFARETYTSDRSWFVVAGINQAVVPPNPEVRLGLPK